MIGQWERCVGLTRRSLSLRTNSAVCVYTENESKERGGRGVCAADGVVFWGCVRLRWDVVS